MASTIAAITTGIGGIVTTADATGNLSLLSGTSTVVAVTSAGAAVTGTMSVSGNVGIGTTAPTVSLHIYNATGSNLLSQADASNSINNESYSNTSNVASVLNLRRSRGTTAAPIAVNSADNVGQLNFSAYGGTNYRNIAAVRSFVDTYTSDTNISGYMAFFTNGGSTAPTERARIDSSGNVGIGTTAAGGTLNVLSNTGSAVGIDVLGRSSDNLGTIRLLSNNAGTNYGSFRGSASSVDLMAVANVPLTFHTNNAEKMRIDSSGRVTTPFQTGFIAKGLAAQTTYTQGQVVVFNSASYNVGSGYNTSNGRFTAPVTGLYSFTFQIYLNPGNTNAPLGFYKNGAMEIFFLQGVTMSGIGLSTLISLSASDYVEVQVRNEVGASATIFHGSDHTQFTGYLLG